MLKGNSVKGEEKRKKKQHVSFGVFFFFFTSSLKMLLAWLLLSAAFSAELCYITRNKWKMNRGSISRFFPESFGFMRTIICT